MSNIPIAEETWFKNTGSSINQEEYTAMIEFAKLHVEAALKAAADSASFSYNASRGKVNYHVYPLENIK